ncbi:MAG: class I SAM-dependent methyltransferase [Bryobacteraceae bacterium]
MSWDPALYEWPFVCLEARRRHGRCSIRGRVSVILDVGCGTGQLTARIAEAGAVVHGIDASAEMIAQARSNYPALSFEQADIARFRTGPLFDAVFSNAVLHWVLDAEAAAQSIALALAPGGRFIAEFGGKGNVGALLGALQELTGIGNPWYFPSVGEYAPILERNGLEVSQAFLFDRLTRTEQGPSGLRDWIRMFGREWPREEAFLSAMEEKLRPRLYRDGAWHIDYRRIRVVAVKL